MSTVEKRQFQAEIQQLLNIVIHSLYTDKEIFIRELVSNAADALEKLRFLQSSGRVIREPDAPLKIAITTNEKEGTVTISDTGVGMTRDELVENLGTIAHSGSKTFLKQLAEDKKPDAKLIGQFGVGFYSAFMVASRVTVESLSHREEAEGMRWSSDGSGGYEIEAVADLARGTRVTVHLKEGEKEYAEPRTIERLLRRYSNFVPFPIELNGNVVNTVQAIWARSKNEIKEEEYNEFYRYIGHDTDAPLYRLHFTADAPLSIQALLYVPARNLESLGMVRTESEVHLYCRKVLIQGKAKGLLPEWLRFLKGVVDSEDLPLNISRETMQDSSLLLKLNKVLTGRFLKFLEEQSERDPVAYDKFYGEFGRFLREGVVTDFAHREALGKLLRYESSALDAGQRTSLSDYVKRMPDDQKEIYYLVAPTRESAESSPYFEVFRARRQEVLFLYDPWDEFVMDHLHEFEGKPLKGAEKAEVKIDQPADGEALSDADAAGLAGWMKEKLGESVGAVRVSSRLVDSPAVLIDPDKFMTTSMRRILKAADPSSAQQAFKYDLEINPRHAVVVRLARTRESDPALAAQVAEQMLDNARVSAGLLDDPRHMIKRLNELLGKVLEPRS